MKLKCGKGIAFSKLLELKRPLSQAKKPLWFYQKHEHNHDQNQAFFVGNRQSKIDKKQIFSQHIEQSTEKQVFLPRQSDQNHNSHPLDHIKKPVLHSHTRMIEQNPAHKHDKHKEKSEKKLNNLCSFDPQSTDQISIFTYRLKEFTLKSLFVEEKQQTKQNKKSSNEHPKRNLPRRKRNGSGTIDIIGQIF